MTLVSDEFIEIYRKHNLFYILRNYILYNIISCDYKITMTNIPYISDYDTSVIGNTRITIQIWYRNNMVCKLYINSNNPTKQNIMNAIKNILL